MTMSDARSTISIVGIDTDYDISKKVEIDLNFTPRTARFISHVSLIKCRLSNLSVVDKPTKLNVCITEDAEGDRMVLTTTETLIEYGITSANKGTAMIKIDGIISLDVADTVFLHAKTDQGTCDIDQVIITYEKSR
mgnify:FL=1